MIDYAGRKGVRVILMTQPYLWRSGLSEAEQRLLWTGGVGPFREQMGQPYYSIEALASGMSRSPPAGRMLIQQPARVGESLAKRDPAGESAERSSRVG